MTWTIEKQTENERICRADFHTDMARARQAQAESFISGSGSAL